MSTPKRHHYVPRFLIANFISKVGKVWVRRTSDGAVWQAKPESVYVERHRYSTIAANGRRDPQLELDYAVLEGAARPVVDKLIADGRAGRSATTSPNEKAVWDEFLYQQMKRVPAMTDQLSSIQSWQDRIESAVSAMEARGLVIDEATLAEFRSPEGMARLAQNATVRALSQSSPAIRALLATSHLELGKAAPGTSFVLGSRPVAGAGRGILAAAQGGHAMWFPIAPDVVVRPAFEQPSPLFSQLPAAAVEAINKVSVAQSDFILANDEEKVRKA